MSILHQIGGAVLRPILLRKSRKRLAPHAGKIRAKGLSAPVEIRRDDRGVPYIFAKNREDLFFAQGFCHAQDRLWQIELNRRIAAGRVSELFGEAMLDIDRISRTIGFARLAEQDYNDCEPGLRKLLDAYANGVNAWMKHPAMKLPVEFSLSRHKPEPYRPQDVLGITRLLSLQLSNGWGHEVIRARLITLLGPEKAAELDIRHADANPITLPEGIEVNEFHGPADSGSSMQAPFQGGSNAWAIAGKLTDTGKPYLCSDPHLSSLAPSIWYQNYLQAPDFRASGVSVPGIPLALIGHNAHIAWGITLSFTDIQDLFAEKFDEKGEKYLHRNEWKPLEIIEEKITVKGRKSPHIEKVKCTVHGPVVSEVLQTGSQPLALCSAALQKAQVTQGWFGLNLASDWYQFREAMRFIEAPGLNIVYADVHGNIGYWNTGRTPVRGKGQGQTPEPGWSGEYDWAGSVPFEEMPHSLNPERGFVISANNKIVGEDFPHFMGDCWMNGYRARRIEELIREKSQFTRDDFPPIQNDVYCPPGVEMAAHFKGLEVTDSHEKEALRLFTEWDGMLNRETIGGSVYQAVKREMLRLLTAGDLDEDLLQQLRGRGLHPLFFKVTEFNGKEIVMMLDHLDQGDSQYLRAAGGKEKLLRDSLSAAVNWLKGRYGNKIEGWQWGKLHQASFVHAMAAKKPLDKIFNIGPRPIGGDTDTVCQTSYPPGQPFEATLASPSYRHIIDLSDLDNSLWVMPPGQSGQPGSPHHQDQLDAWVEGRYFPMRWNRESIEKEATTVLWIG